MPFFSIIIPTFNRAALLQQALESIAQQTFRDFETLVVDDGSTDATPQVAASFGARLLRQENRGPGAARNLGIQQASGRYIAFLDSDDQWLPWTLDTYYRIIAEKHGPAFLSGISVPLDETVSLGSIQFRDLKIEFHTNLLAACNDRVPPVGGTPSICLRRENLLRTGGFTTQRINGEDTDLWLRLGDAPGFVRILNPPVFRQRHHAGNISHQTPPALAGAWYLMQQERNGAYPGGPRHHRRRLRIICGTVRSVSLECLAHGRADAALQLYRASFGWNFALGNFKYLLAFPLLAWRGKPFQRKESPCASTA
ncbi:MAG TPA: glycosyltransferase family A protein [Verrucomicrobiae bacterium]|jgi:glycosyltransferase involved in cell wall biosynthesis|nr:glycosyltransferase family A protein [Verrucomicrobiae bacterium]